MNREGARELLLPLLRVAAEHAGVSEEGLRRWVKQYAFPDFHYPHAPPELQQHDDTSPGKDSMVMTATTEVQG